MPVADYVNFTYMREFEQETMFYDGQLLTHSSSYDSYGGEINTYTPGTTFKCGVKQILASETPAFTGVSINFDVRLRLPLSIVPSLHQRDRIRVTSGGITNDYELIGAISPSPFTLVIEASRVQ